MRRKIVFFNILKTVLVSKEIERGRERGRERKRGGG